MAIKYNDYVIIADNLKIHKDNDHKFYFDLVLDGDRYRKAYTIKNKNDWGKRDCIKYAKERLKEYIDSIEAGYSSTDNIKLDTLFELYFESLKDTKWKTIKGSIYNRYIGVYKDANSKELSKLTKEEISRKRAIDKNKIGTKYIDKIKPMHITKILITMDKWGLSPRTQKSILEVLKPMFKFAQENKILQDIPTSNINIKIPSQKKIVTEATLLFQRVYTGITTYYKNEPFYQALFLFGFTGRRKSEILNLKWENIDFTNNYYWIEDTKNDDKQKYPLPPYIKKQIILIKDGDIGLVFKSPVTGKVITNIDRQMRQLKKHIGIDNLSLHYMRNILVSMLAEQQTEAIVLSGILGHKDVNTINKYLSINHFKSGQVGLDKIDDILDVEIEDKPAI